MQSCEVTRPFLVRLPATLWACLNACRRVAPRAAAMTAISSLALRGRGSFANAACNARGTDGGDLRATRSDARVVPQSLPLRRGAVCHLAALLSSASASSHSRRRRAASAWPMPHPPRKAGRQASTRGRASEHLAVAKGDDDIISPVSVSAQLV